MMFLSKNNILYNKIIIGTLILIFVVYNLVLYKRGAFIKEQKLSQTALFGQQLWQDYNCTACHQMYGLGGYLGPDLTNLTSDSLKTAAYIKVMINAGKNTMPKYSFNDEELEAFLAYFKAIDKTGYFPDKNAKKCLTGWIELTTKNKEND